MNYDRPLSMTATLGRALRFAMLGLAIGAAAGTAGCDRLLGAEKRIERAAEEFEAGRYGAAMRDVKTALEAEPDSVDGRVLLARINLRTGDAEAARKELDRAVEAGADPAVVRGLHYDILLAQGRYEDALIAAAVDEDLDPVRRLVVMGTAQTALGKHDDAQASIDAALQQDPGDRDARLLQARWYWATGRVTDAHRTVDLLIEEDRNSAEAWLYKGRFAFGTGDTTGAEAAFVEGRKSAEAQLSVPDQLALHVGIVEARLARGDMAGAATEIKALEAKAPNAFVTRYLKARIAYGQGDYRQAVAELQRGLIQQPANASGRLLLGAALFEQGSVEQAESELSRLIAENPDNLEARKLLSRIYLSRNDAASARRVLANAPSMQVRDTGAEWLSGAAMLLSGLVDEAIATLEKASAADPGNIPLRLDLARAYLAAGRRAEAGAILQSVSENDGGARRRQLLVLAEVAGREPAEARAAIARLVEENPADADLLGAAGSFLLAAGDAAGAADVFEKMVAAAPANVEARLGLATAALRLLDRGRADTQIRKVLELDPSNERAYIGLASIAFSAGDGAAARQWLERAIGADPAAVEARLQLAELALADRDTARMKALAEQALAVTKNRPETLLRVGQLLNRASMYDEALQRFNEAAAAGSDDAAVNAALTLIALGRNDEARSRLEAAANRRRDWDAPVAFLAALDSQQRRFDQALARVATMERAGGSPVAADQIRADIHMASGQPKLAVEALERAANAAPSSRIAVKLFRARRAAGLESPQSSLAEWLKRDPNDVAVRVLLAEYLQQTGQRPQAIAEYERAVALLASPPIMNNLAWLYYQVGDERALDLARRAHEAAPTNAEIADTYGWVLVEKGRVEEGLPILEKAAAAATNPEIRYHYAAALARSGRREQAAAELRKLLDGTQAFASRAQAEALLETLSGG